MSETDSFISEVSEELRRDRMSRLLRRWGWVAVLAVIVLVGTAAFTEWRKARDAAAAEAFGDAVLGALGDGTTAERTAALDAVVPADARQAAILGLLRAAAADLDPADDDASATATVAPADLVALAEMEGLPPVYRQLALLRGMMSGGTGDAARDAGILDELAQPGAPFRHLAVEQQALAAVAADDVPTALDLLRTLAAEDGVTESLRRRAAQLIVALGGTVEPA